MILLNHYVLTRQPRRALHRLLCRHSRWVVSHAGHTVRPPTVQDTGCGQPFVMWCGDIENVWNCMSKCNLERTLPISSEYGIPRYVSKPRAPGKNIGRWPRCHLPYSWRKGSREVNAEDILNVSRLHLHRDLRLAHHNGRGVACFLELGRVK